MEDVARAFDIILHRGTIGSIYNVGGTNELSNLDVAKHLIKILCAERGERGERREGADAEQDEAQSNAFFQRYITYVEDRAFNDLRYQIDSSRLRSLGWEEQVSWEDGLRRTVDWYLKNSSNWPSELLDAALVAHPRMLGSAVRMAGF